MINVAKYKADLAALPGDKLIVPKSQMDQLLDELATGQEAKRALTSLNIFAAMATKNLRVAA
jgi:hypothetical protein